MTKLFENPEGADAQSNAVLAYLAGHASIEESWNQEFHAYDAEPEIARWHNCREQGYVVSLRSQDRSRQLNIAFFEHRNSDEIVAVKWEQNTINPPTIETAKFGNIYKDKYDVSHRASYAEAAAMADWIHQQLVEFWKATAQAKAA